MGVLGRAVFREIAAGAALGTVLFIFVLFLQRAGRLFEILVQSSAPLTTAGYLFLLVLPRTLPFAVPIGVLVGVLIGLSRMAADGEIMALRAAGVPGRRVLAPVFAFSLVATAATAGASLWLTPWSIRETYGVLNRLIAEQLTAEVQPRVFEEQFPRTILYVGDVIPGPVPRWRNIFMADLTPPEERPAGGRELGQQPRITIAAEAVAVADVAHNRIQLSMTDASSHETGRNPVEYYSTAFPRGEQALAAKPRGETTAKAFVSTDTGPLLAEARRSREASIELHQRFALPLACVLLAMLGVPLGISSRKAGKSAAFVLAVFLAFLYWVMLISLIGLAEQSKLPAVVAVWTPNAVFALFGVFLIAGLERPGDRDLIGRAWGRLESALRGIRGRMLAAEAPGGGPSANGRTLGRLPLLPQLIDTYVLGVFLFYFSVFVVSFVAMTHVFIFFDLLSDMVKNRIPMSRMLTYHLFLTPKLIYDVTPVSVLVAVLVTFGILTKHNEVMAMKACGVSLYRMARPVLLASSLLSLALFAFDHYYVPEANRIQDAILNEIKGRPVQTYLSPDRKWIFGRGSRIYYYKYFDPGESVLGGVNVYTLDPSTFRLLRHVSAERARWEPSLKTWIFQDGWTRELAGVRVTSFQPFQATTLPELDEPPGYFLKEVKQDKQMNFRELDGYIRELQQGGFDTVRLRVQFHKKFSVPLFAFIMALISVPFAFLTGNRGALAGVGVSFSIAIAYWSVSQLFEQVGNLNQLPATLAAWSPDAVFALAGMYLFTRLRT